MDSKFVEGQKRLMNQCQKLTRGLYGESVNAGMASTRGSAAFCRCGTGTGRPSVTLGAFLTFLQYLLHFSLGTV